MGYLMTFFSFRFFVELCEGNPVPFALNYTLGNIFSQFTTMFLCGPKRQFKNLFDDRRKFSSITYLSCLGGTLLVVFLPIKPNGVKLFLLLVLIITQFCASVWYTLSYIPYGRRTLLRFLKRQLGLDEESIVS